MSFFENIAQKFPELKEKLRLVSIRKKPVEYIKEVFVNTILFGVVLTIIFFIVLTKTGASIFIGIVFMLLIFPLLAYIFMRRLDVAILKKMKDIDRDALFAGRFLLVKLNAGRPLLNSIMDASKGYGVAGKYFQDIVRDIDLGTPMEEALDRAYKITPSKKMKKILFQINNALKIGIDVSQPLEATLEEIMKDEELEIQKYGKKLNSITMFYMLLAIVVPSLGITLFTIVGSIVNISINFQTFTAVLFFLIVIQLVFVSVFKSIRPNLNL